MIPQTRATTIAILAMGGEGGGVLASWIVDVAESAGCFAQMTSVPGVAQRTGSTVYYLELFPDAGREPVLALMPVPGEVDIVIASELMEAGRAVQRGLVTPDRTALIASTHRVYSMTERTALGDGRVDSEALIDAAKASARVMIQADFARIAAESGSVISAALLGALATSRALPFSREAFEQAIRSGGIGVDASLRAFQAGFAAAESGAAVQRVPAEPALETQAIIEAGMQRLTDYQDERYAQEYRELLAPLPDGDVLREAARYLALWMSYEDAIRVADLKIRAERFERVRSEVRAEPGQVVRIHEYLHPHAGDIADFLPARIGGWLLASGWARRVVDRLTRRGRVLNTTSVLGYLQLYMLARMRPMRRRSLRFQRERLRIRAWLALVAEIAASDPALARELAECPRVLKGYGDTYRHGSRQFERLMEAAQQLRQSNDGAGQLRRLREAALADETGEKLEQELRTQ